MEIRSAATQITSNNNNVFGYASVFNSPTDIRTANGTFREQVLPGAFRNQLDKDINLVFNHKEEDILGNTTAGTLTLREDSKGLYFEANLDDDPANHTASKVRRLLARKELRGCSFGFTAIKDTWTKDNGVAVRSLEELDLDHIAIVIKPAYSSTSVDLRSVSIPNDDLEFYMFKQKTLELLINTF